MATATITAEMDVFRFDPTSESKPRYQRYSLELPPHAPVLTALLKIREETDPTLTLRYSCRSAICGSCAMLINARSRLACQTPVGPEMERHGRIVIEPMGNQPVLRDLVVETEPFWRQYHRVEPYLKPDPLRPMPVGKETPMTPSEVKRFQETPRCIACGACYSACPAVTADPEFPGPMALAKLYRYVVDPRDGAHQDRLLRIQTSGLWLCLRCHLCTEACPKDVRPSERIRDLKELAIAAQGVTEPGSRHAVAFKDNIAEKGVLNEFKLARQSLGPSQLLGQLSQGVKIRRRKPELMKKPKPIDGHAEVVKLYELLDSDEEGTP